MQLTPILFPDGVHQNEPPIFLFKGILEDPQEFELFIQEFHKINKSPIIILETGKYTIDEIVEELQNKANTKRFPFRLFAVSNGCLNAFEAAQLLKLAGHDSYVIFVDGPSANSARAYFSDPNSDSTKDLITVCNTAARASGLKEIELNKTQLEQLSKHDRKTKLEEIIKQFKDQGSSESRKKFMQYVNAIQANLEKITQERPIVAKLPIINLVATTDTMKKYEPYGPYLGWQEYTEVPVNIWGTPAIKAEAHQELLTNPETCAEIAGFADKIFTEAVLVAQVIFLLNQKAYEGADLNAVLHQVQTRCSSGNSTDNDDSMSPKQNTPRNEEDPMNIDTPVRSASSTNSEPKKNDQCRDQFSLFRPGYNTRGRDEKRKERLTPTSFTPNPETPDGSRTPYTP